MSDNSKPLVDFIGIGGMKCATTTLYTTLEVHPNVIVTKHKEANFFNKTINDDRIAWYDNQFDRRLGVRCDITPAYTKRHLFPDTAENMHRLVPSAKLIYLVRDPVARAVSHVHHNILRDRVRTKELADIFTKNDNYQLCSAYHYQLEPFLKYYPRESIMVVSFEEFVRNFAGTIERITEFMGLDGQVDLSLRASNLSGQRYRIPLYDLVHARVKNRVLKKCYFNLCRIVYGNVSKPVFPQEQLNELARALKPDIDQFLASYPSLGDEWKLYHKCLANG